MAAARAGGCHAPVPDPVPERRSVRQPAGAAVRGGRVGGAGARLGAARAAVAPRTPGRGAARVGRAQPGLDRARADRVRGALRAPVAVLGRLRAGAQEPRLLLHPVHAAAQAAHHRALDAAGPGGLLLACRGAGARVRRRRLPGVRDQAPVPEPEADRVEPVRVVLPGQLAVLRPEHLRPLPRDGDDRPGGDAAVGAPRPRHRDHERPARRAVGRADPLVLPVELRCAARGTGRAGCAEVRPQAGDRGGHGRGRGRARRGGRGTQPDPPEPALEQVGRQGHQRTHRPDARRPADVHRPAAAGFGSGAFAKEFRARERTGSRDAASASTRSRSPSRRSRACPGWRRTRPC